MALIQLTVASVAYKNLTTATAQVFQSERIEGLQTLGSLTIAQLNNGSAVAGSSIFSYAEEGSTTKVLYTVNETLAQIITATGEDTNIAKEKAMEGDILMVISPTTVTTSAITGAWTRTVTITLKTAAGETHTWYDKTHTTTAAIADTSSAGTATIPSTSLVFSGGIATKVITGSANAWLAAETNTLTLSNLTILGYTVTGGTSVQTFA